MKVKPMIFNTEMVLALLNGRKAQTRRPINISDDWELKDQHICRMITPKPGRWGVMKHRALYDSEYEHQVIPAPAMPGDLIYVRETFSIVPRTAYSQSTGVQQLLRPDHNHDAAIYRAGFDRSSGSLRWKPSIHMPRWASRLTLKVTGVRVERVQDISKADAEAEGFKLPPVDGQGFSVGAKTNFRHAWEQIYGESWERNDWVWVIDFEVIRQNVDEYLKEQEHAA